MRRTAILLLIAVSGFALACLGAGRGGMSIERLHDNLFLITGNGGNSAVFIHSTGVVLVDTKFENSGQRLLDLIRTVTDKPVTHIVNTHSHFDHVGSNSFFPASVEVIAHENAPALMMRMSEFDEPSERQGLPDRTFKDTLTLFANDDAIDLYYFGAAHTNNDVFVVFRRARVMHAGDTFPGVNPVTPDGGSPASYPATMNKAATTIKEIDTVISGHGPIATWQGFEANAAALRGQR